MPPASYQPTPGTALALATGDPARTYRKTVLRPGDFVTGSGQALHVTPEYVSRLATAFDRMTAAGVGIPIYATTHAAALADTRAAKPERIAQNCIGWITGAEARPDGSLEMHHSFADAEAERTAKRTGNVSVCIEPGYRDGEGREYGDAVTHVLITAEPVVPGQSDFAPIAADLLTFSRAAEHQPTQEPDMDLTKLAAALGLASDADEAACLAKIESITAEPAPAKPAPAEPAPEPAPAPAPAQPATFSRERLEIAAMAREMAELELDRLVASKAILPAARDALLPALTGTAEAPAVAMLSRAEGEKLSPARAIIAALAANAPAPPSGSQTPAQIPSGAATLSHEPGDGIEVTKAAAADIAKQILGG